MKQTGSGDRICQAKLQALGGCERMELRCGDGIEKVVLADVAKRPITVCYASLKIKGNGLALYIVIQ